MKLRDLPPLAALRAFAALAEARSMTEAGTLLNVSHAAIGQQIRALEAFLGVTLIERAGRSVTLTAQGADLAQAVTTAFDTIAQRIDVLTGAEADRPLQVSTTPMFAASWLMPRLADFRVRHPGIDLMINPTTDVVDLSPGGVDLSIRYGMGGWPGVISTSLVETDFVIVAAPGLIGGRRIDTPADLLGFPWLIEIGSKDVEDWLHRNGLDLSSMRGVTHVPGNLMLDGVRQGQGVAAARHAFVQADIRAGSLLLLHEEKQSDTGYYLVHRPGVLRPQAKAFIGWLRQQAAADRRMTS